MKTAKLLLPVLFTLLFTACNKEANEQKNIEDKYMGEWVATPGKDMKMADVIIPKIDFSRNENGTIFLKKYIKNGTTENVAMKYEPKGKFLVIPTPFGDIPLAIEPDGLIKIPRAQILYSMKYQKLNPTN